MRYRYRRVNSSVIGFGADAAEISDGGGRVVAVIPSYAPPGMIGGVPDLLVEHEVPDKDVPPDGLAPELAILAQRWDREGRAWHQGSQDHGGEMLRDHAESLERLLAAHRA